MFYKLIWTTLLEISSPRIDGPNSESFPVDSEDGGDVCRGDHRETQAGEIT